MNSLVNRGEIIIIILLCTIIFAIITAYRDQLFSFCHFPNCRYLRKN